jgi:rare lipoprotein A
MSRFCTSIAACTGLALLLSISAQASEVAVAAADLHPTGAVTLEAPSSAIGRLLDDPAQQSFSLLEELVRKSSRYESVEGYASYYAKRFEGRKTTSGLRYEPEKLTAAHVSLPLGTVVRVINPATSQEVHVTITDRCAPTSYHFIDLSQAAARKIGLWGKGRIRVVIIPLLEEPLQEPA